MLTVTHIITLLTIGVLVSGGISMIVEWFAHGLEEDGKTTASRRFRRRAPLVLGVLVAVWGFPATWSVVVTPVEIGAWWHIVLWAAGGVFAGLVAGVGARGAYETARKLQKKVAE